VIWPDTGQPSMTGEAVVGGDGIEPPTLSV
jgi:hypothetical protein